VGDLIVGSAGRLSGPGDLADRPPFKTTATLCVFLLTLGLVFDFTGCLPLHLRLFLLYTLLLVPICLRHTRRRLVLALALVLTVGLNATVTSDPLSQTGLLLLVTLLVWDSADAGLRVFWPPVVFFALAHAFLFVSPKGYFFLDGLAQRSAALYATLLRDTCNLGYTYQNIGSVLVFLTLSVFLIRDGVSSLRTACFAILLVLVTAVTFKFVLYRIDINADLTLELDWHDYRGLSQYAGFCSRLIVLAFPGVLFLAHLALFLVFHPTWLGKGTGEDGPAIQAPRFARVGTPLCFLAGLGLLTFAFPLQASRTDNLPRAVFYGRGVVSFSKPEYGERQYGSLSAGMYGTFVDFVRLCGFRTEVLDELPDDLDGVDLLIFTNLDHPLTADAYASIRDFVAEGGDLWVLGDHTFIKNGRNHINDLLAPFSIKFENDSAKNLVQGWFESYEIRLAKPFGLLENDADNSLSMLVGASLDIEPPAVPFILGRYGYSDMGTLVNDEETGHLGDFRYTRDERLGDLVLVAGQRYGNGSVVVFGDTTSFFNSNTGKTYTLLQAVLGTFARRPPSLSQAWFGRLLPLLLAGVLLLSLRFVPAARTPAVLGVMVLYTLVWLHGGERVRFDRTVARKQLALIDFSHNPRASKHASMDDGLFGLKVNLLRHGLLPLDPATWEPALLRDAACLFLVAPQKRFGGSEIADIRTFLERGGNVVLTCGRDGAENCRPLLDAMGLEVLNIPLGRFFDRQAFGRPVSFFSAWPIAAHDADVEVITAYDDWPLIVARRWQKGTFVLIGDSEFLHNKNLEREKKYDINNIEFLRGLLDRLVGNAES